MAAGKLIGRHRDHVAELAAHCSGSIVDWAGDGCFLAFDTSSAAPGAHLAPPCGCRRFSVQTTSHGGRVTIGRPRIGHRSQL